MATSESSKRNEEGRYQVLRYLYARPATALSAEAVQDGLRREGFRADLEEVTLWLDFWTAPEFAAVKTAQLPHGSTIYYQITSAGQIRHERS